MIGQQLGDVDRDALYGLRGVRVGEASHPGPRRRRRVRSSSVESSWSGPDRTLLDDFERDLLASGLERTVGTQIDVSSDDEPLLRPSSGRHVVPRMGERDHGEEGEPTTIAVGPRGLPGPGCRRGLVVEVAPGVVDASAVALPSSHVIPDVAESDAPVFHWDPDEDDELDALSRNATDALGGHADLQRPTQVDRDDEVTVSVGRVTPWLHADSVAGTGIASQASGDRGAGACPANRFFSLTDNSEVDGQVAPTSDTDSLGPPRNRRRRLRLNWNSQGSNDRLGPVHQPRHQQVRAAEVLFHELARRVGAVPVGSPVPRIVLQQRWSPVNVPLMWAAAGSESSTPVLEFLCEITAGVPDIHFNEGTLSTNVAVRTGWQALREAMRSWGVGQEVDLQAWLRGQGFPGPQPGNHISARAQEYILSEGCRSDARVALLEAVFVTTTLEMGRRNAPASARIPSAATERVRRASQVPPRVDHSSWASLDSVDVEDLFSQRIPMLKSCPHFFRGRLRHSFRTALEERCRAALEGDVVAEARAWKLFAVVPIMLLSRPRGIGRIGRDELASRADQFARGEWRELINMAVQNVSTFPNSKREASSEAERRGLAAQEKVKRGQVSRARQALVGAALSPKTEETLEELRRRRPQAALRQIPQEVMDYAPDSPLAMDMKIFAKCLRTAPAGSSAGPGGCSNEMLKVCLDDEETCQLLFLAAEDFARGTAPNVSQCFMLANLTALQKKDGGVRGIATGTTFRRLVAKTLARQFSRQVEAACAPFSLHYLLVQGSIAWATWSEQPQMPIVKRHSSPLTASGRTIMFSGVPSWQSCLRCRDSAHSCHLYVPSTLVRRGTFGKTMSGNDTKSINMREANRETL